MKKATITVVALLALSLTSCRGYEREQDRLDRESEGKGELLKAESTKKVKIEQAKADYESAKLDAQTKLERARASAEAKLINAKASAEAAIINAKGQAEANRLLTESLTPMILEYAKVNRWNGKLPTTSVGSGSSTIIGLK
jgi:hypothetical protein